MICRFRPTPGLAECLVVARKLKCREQPSPRLHSTSLTHRPQGFAHASALAGNVASANGVRQVEDGPYGGTPLTVGAELAGQMMTAPNDTESTVWGAVRLSDYSLAQTAHALFHSGLWLPGRPAALELNVALLGSVGELGFVHRDITGPAPRGPFDRAPASPTATYPALWNHDSKNETRIVCLPDSELLVRQGMEEKAATIADTASRAHVNLDFRFNSQPLAVAFTEQESIGGTAWPNVIFTDGRFDYTFALWCNSTLGLLSHWWHANRQQSGRGRTTIRAVESLPVLDFRTLSAEQLRQAETIFDEFRDLQLQPAYLADADPNRAHLDRRVICDLLGFDPPTYTAVRRLAAKWCAEPSVHGGKRRPRGARLVI